jgi:hypothetical protein
MAAASAASFAVACADGFILSACGAWEEVEVARVGQWRVGWLAMPRGLETAQTKIKGYDSW